MHSRRSLVQKFPSGRFTFFHRKLRTRTSANSSSTPPSTAHKWVDYRSRTAAPNSCLIFSTCSTYIAVNTRPSPTQPARHRLAVHILQMTSLDWRTFASTFSSWAPTSIPTSPGDHPHTPGTLSTRAVPCCGRGLSFFFFDRGKTGQHAL